MPLMGMLIKMQSSFKSTIFYLLCSWFVSGSTKGTVHSQDYDIRCVGQIPELHFSADPPDWATNVRT